MGTYTILQWGAFSGNPMQANLNTSIPGIGYESGDGSLTSGTISSSGLITRPGGKWPGMAAGINCYPTFTISNPVSIIDVYLVNPYTISLAGYTCANTVFPVDIIAGNTMTSVSSGATIQIASAPQYVFARIQITTPAAGIAVTSISPAYSYGTNACICGMVTYSTPGTEPAFPVVVTSIPATLVTPGGSCYGNYTLPSAAGVVWTSSNLSVATVAGNIVSIESAGSASIVGKTSSSLYGVMSITTPPLIITPNAVMNTSAVATLLCSGSVVPQSWTSSTPGVATVAGNQSDTSGTTATLTIVGAGTTTVTATSAANANIKATQVVTVSAQTVSIQEGKGTYGATLSIATTPPGFTSAYTWTSADTSIADVDYHRGVLTVYKQASVTITATSVANNAIAATRLISMQPPTLSAITGQGWSGSTLSVSVSPPVPGFVPNIQWSSLDPSIATIAPGSGVLTVVSSGSARIRAVSQTNINVAVTTPISVTLPVLTIAPTTTAAYGAPPLTAKMTAGTLSDESVFFAADDGLSGTVATIDNSGALTILQNGTVAVTATATVNHNISVTQKITVQAPTLTINQSAAAYGASSALSVASSPATFPATVTWKITNGTAATIDPAKGILTITQSGNVTVVATSATAGYTSVSSLPQVIAVTAPTLTINQTAATYGASSALSVASSPATFPATVTWKITNGTAATIDPAKGILAITQSGNVTVVATSTTAGYTSVSSLPRVIAVTAPTLTINQTAATYGASSALSVASSPATFPSPVTWKITKGTAATIDAAKGILTITQSGNVTVVATSTTAGYTSVSSLPQVIVVTAPTLAISQTAATYGASSALSVVGNPATFAAAVAWRITKGTAATIDAVTGSLAITQSGNVTVVATSTTAGYTSVSSPPQVIAVTAPTLSVKQQSVTYDNPGLTVTSPTAGFPLKATWVLAGASAAINAATGILTITRGGVVNVTATSATPGYEYVQTPSQSVTVIAPSFVIDQQSVTYGNSTLTVSNSSTSTTFPKGVTWKLTGACATIGSTSGIMTIVSGGVAQVTATSIATTPQISVTRGITVIVPTMAIVQNTATYGSKLTVTVFPSSFPSAVTWLSQDKSTADIDVNGNVTVLKAGKVVFVATTTSTTSPIISAFQSVTVTLPTLQIQQSGSGRTVKLSVKATPPAFPTTVVWSMPASSRTDIVQDAGTLTFANAGTVKVQATSTVMPSVSATASISGGQSDGGGRSGVAADLKWIIPVCIVGAVAVALVVVYAVKHQRKHAAVRPG